MSSYNGNFYVTVFGVPDMQSRDAVMYAAPYTGPGDYTLELANVFGDIEEGSEMSYILFAIADYNSDGYVTQNLIMPGENTITVRFNSAEQETVVPEPTTCAYALMGLGSLLGIKRRVKK